MNIEKQNQLTNTQAKLDLLKKAVVELKTKPGPNDYVDEVTLRSLQSQIKELKEKNARFRSRVSTRVDAG
jgi:hypothetical protein